MASNYLAEVTDKKGNKLVVEMRADGYFNASKMCQSTKKLWGNYYQVQRTRDFLHELSELVQLPITATEGQALIVSKKGGVAQGTWVHRKVSTKHLQFQYRLCMAFCGVRAILQFQYRLCMAFCSTRAILQFQHCL